MRRRAGGGVGPIGRVRFWSIPITALRGGNVDNKRPISLSVRELLHAQHVLGPTQNDLGVTKGYGIYECVGRPSIVRTVCQTIGSVASKSRRQHPGNQLSWVRKPRLF
jgi:hypothetical protein